MSDKSLFSKIIDGEIPGDFVHRDDVCVVIRDINPQAPVHLLVIPIEPVVGVQEAGPEHAAMLGHLLVVARQVADAEGLGASGFRLVINAGDDGGQEVPHLHVHVLGGRAMQWPPG